MKRIIFIMFVLFGLIGASQSITSAEYFFNNDPGVGNGTVLTVNSNTGELTQTFSIPTTGLPEGFNTVCVRTFNNDNNWSLYDRKNFYLKSFDSFTIAAAEYFFNTDPGMGNGTALSVDTNSGDLTQAFTISTSGLNEGFHSFYLRTKDNANHWSLYDRQIIYIKEFNFLADEVTNAEYFIDTDPGVGNGTAISFGNPSQTEQVININTTGLADGEHLFYVRVQDSNGDWSIYDRATFTIDNNLNIEDSLFKSTKIHPRPFESRLNISLPLNVEIEHIEIYDTLGQSVYSSTENKTTLKVEHLKSGLYFLNLKTDMGTASFKIVKK